MTRSFTIRAMLLLAAGLLCAWPATVSARTPLPQEILDNWAAALGGREDIDNIKALKSSANISLFGMEGTLTQTMAQSDSYLMELDLAGIFKVTHLATDGQTWVRDQDGNVSEVAGKERGDMMNALYFENLNHLRSGAPVSLIQGVERDEDSGLLVVKIKVPEGSQVEFHLDPQSWLPVRSESTDSGGGTTVVTYSAWKPVQGVLFAHQIHQSDGEAQNDMTLTVSEIVVNPYWADDPFLPLDTDENDSIITDAELAADIPIKLRGVHIYVEVMVNGQGPFQFVYDSGAGMTVINRGLAESLQLPLEGAIAGGGVGEASVEVALATGLTLGLPGVEAKNQTIAVVDLAGTLEKRIGTRVDGILGFGFISRFTTEIDYANSRLGLHDPETFTYAGSGTVVPMVIDGSTPHVEAVVRGHGGDPVTGYFMLDTGSGGAVSLSGPFADRHGIVATMPSTVTNQGGFGIGGATTTTVGRLQRVELGGIVFAEPIASVSRDTSGAGADETTAGLIGGRLLSRCRTFLDYAGGRLILEPYPTLTDPFNWNKSGLTLVTGGRGDFNSFRVASVVEESPSQAAGLRVGDQLLVIDGKPASEWEADQLTELFRGQDQDLEIQLRRGGREETVILRLREFI